MSVNDKIKQFNKNAKLASTYGAKVWDGIEDGYKNYPAEFLANLDRLKASAKGKKGLPAEIDYTRIRQQVQQALKENGMQNRLLGEERTQKVRCILKEGKFTFSLEDLPQTEPEESEKVDGVESESLPLNAEAPKVEMDLTQIILDYIAVNGEKEGFADDIKSAAETLTQLAQPYYTK